MNSKNTADRIYYNIAIPYSPTVDGTSPAVYQQQLNEAIVWDPSQYYLSIIRFTIPTANIPIMFPFIQPFPNVDINKTIYSVTLTFGPPAGPPTSISKQYVEFVTSSPAEPPPPVPTASQPNVQITPYYYIYSYINWIEMINTALTNAFNAIPGKPAGSKAPYFIYNNSNNTISLIAQRQYYDINNEMGELNIFKVYCNYELLNFLDGMNISFFGSGLANGLDVQFLIQNNHNNYYNPPDDYVAPPAVPKYFSVPQEYGTLTNWNVFQSISIISNLLPTKQEYVPATYDTAQNGVVNSRGILTDFEPILQNGPEARTTVQYQVQSPYRIINLTSQVPLTKIDINVYWVDKKGNQYILDLPIDSVLTMKMVFVKKSTYSG